MGTAHGRPGTTTSSRWRCVEAILGSLATVPAWAGQLAAVVDELPQDIAGDKGIDSSYRHEAMAWLRATCSPSVVAA